MYIFNMRVQKVTASLVTCLLSINNNDTRPAGLRNILFLPREAHFPLVKLSVSQHIGEQEYMQKQQ